MTECIECGAEADILVNVERTMSMGTPSGDFVDVDAEVERAYCARCYREQSVPLLQSKGEPCQKQE